MDAWVSKLLARSDVTRSDPATVEIIDELSREIGAPLPEQLIELWRVSDGVEAAKLDATFIGPTKALELLRLPHLRKLWFDYGFLPFLDDHQSNFLVYCFKSPMAPRIFYMLHDDAPLLLYRDMSSCLAAILEQIKRKDADQFFHETRGDYSFDAPRPISDQSAARELLKTDGEHHEWNFAIQLLDASNLDEWKLLLETDHFIRRDAVARLKKMKTKEARALQRQDQESFDQFAELMRKALIDAGLNVGERNDDTLKVEGRWKNLEAFYYRRHIPNAMARLVSWITDQHAKRDPRTRADNYFAKDV